MRLDRASLTRSCLMATAGLALTFTSSTLAQLLAYDGFGNGPLADLAGSTGGTGWAGPWADSGDTIMSVYGDGLTYPNLLTTPGQAVTLPNNDSAYPIARYERLLPSLPVGTSKLYVSFLIRPEDNYGSFGGLQFGNYPYAMSVGFPMGWYSLGLMVSEGLGDASNVDLIAGETYFVVCKISKNTPSNGLTYRLFYGPAVGSTEPNFPLCQYAVPAPNTLPTVLRINNQPGFGELPGFSVDEVRVGTTWASVMPPAPPPCPGDLNHDGMVDAADLASLLGAWGSAAGDLNADGTTNAADLSILLGYWGSCG